VTGFMLALYAPAIFYDGLIQKSALDVFFLALLLWILSRLIRRAGTLAALGLGLALGGLCLTRENALVFVPLLLLWMIWYFRDRPRRWPVYALLFLLGTGLILLPVALRNQAVGGEFHLTTSQFGPNFYIGNNPDADGAYQPLRYGHGSAEYEQLEATQLAEEALGRSLTPAEVSDYWTEQALEYIRAHPGDWLRLTGRKLLLALNAVETVDTIDQYTYADWSLPLRVTNRFANFGIIAALAWIGLAVTWRRRRDLLVFYALGFVYLASLIAFFVLGRYRFPLAVLLMLFSGAGLAGLARFFLARRLRAVVLSALLLVALIVVMHLPVIAKGPMRAVTYSNLGNRFSAAGNLDRAEELYRRSVAAHPDYAKGHFHLGLALQSQEKLLEAVEAYYAALGINPGYLEAHNNVALALREMGDYDAAIDHLRQALRAEPGSDLTQRNLAETFLDAGRLPQAEQVFRSLLERAPEDARAWGGLGRLLTRQQRYDEAIAAFERALELDPDYSAARENLAQVYEAQGRGSEELAALEEAAAGSASAAPHVALADRYRALGRLDDAETAYRAALQADSTSADAWNGLGVLAATRGEGIEAIERYQRALELDPELALAHFNLANVLRAAGRTEEMVAHLERAVELEPTFIEALANLGLGLTMLGRTQEAEVCHRRRIELQPDDPAAYQHLAALLLGEGREKEAQHYFEQALRLDPEDPATLQRYAWMLATTQAPERRDPQRAVELAQRAAQLTGGQDVIILDTLAIAYAVAGRFPEAMETARRALRRAREVEDPRLIQQIEGRLQQFEQMQSGSPSGSRSGSQSGSQ